MSRVVLLVEDDATLREALTRQLRAAGYSVVPLANVNDARAVIAFFTPGVVVMDVILPDGHAAPFVREIRGKHRVVLISGYAEGAELAHDLDLPFVPKPFEIEQLEHAMSRALSH